MRLSGYQPHYFPRLHYVKRALDSDLFELSDYLQFVKKHEFKLNDGTHKRGKSYQAHASIKLSSGIYHLVVPTHDGQNEPINKTPIVYNHDWVYKHLQTIQMAYARAPAFSSLYPELKALLEKRYESLGELTVKTVLWSLLRAITDKPIEEISTNYVNHVLKHTAHPFRLRQVIVLSESTIPSSDGNPSEWIADMCQALGATEYITGGTAQGAYMDSNLFAKASIKVIVQEWICPVYPQQYIRAGFLPNLSAMDLLMNADLKMRQRTLI